MGLAVASPARWPGALAALAGWRRAVAAALFGAVGVLAFAPVDITFALVPAAVGLLWLLDGCAPGRAGLGRALGTGWWFGLGHFAAGFYWITEALLVDAEQFGWLAPVAVPGIAAGLGLVTALLAGTLHLSGLRGAARILAFAALWGMGEWLRGTLLGGFPWNLFGTGWSWSLAMQQSVALFGVYGLGLITALAAAAPAILAPPPSRCAEAGWRRGAVLAGAALLLGALGLWGGLRLGGLPAPGAVADSVPGVQLRLVQANIQQSLKWLPETRRRNFELHLSMSKVQGHDEASHIVWPETAAQFLLAEDEDAQAAVAAVVPSGGAVLTGTVRRDPATGEVWNSLLAIDGRGAVAGIYDKARLVPFGEYMPLRGILGLDKLTAGGTDFSAGPGPRSLRLPGLPPVSPLICYEAIFSGAVTDPQDRPAWLLNVTNDAWFGRSAGPYQHFAAARLRAIEEGLPLVRAANTGISAVVDPYGRIVARLGLGLRGVVDSPLPRGLAAPPPFTSLGNGWLAAGVALFLMLAGLMRRRPHNM
ncbi:MAG: apolipoprotein N-acyltransferase [Rhodospirillaceae bacterium]|jgi:apolipoprotein N-acyltransferase|nr:apolipoprotein N-acyltransferase [Rhodospirillaceae bacterium]MBT6118408.1 apolipoprotein N-acyltransferase [Rhodospirillaceae bacterium]